MSAVNSKIEKASKVNTFFLEFNIKFKLKTAFYFPAELHKFSTSFNFIGIHYVNIG